MNAQVARQSISNSELIDSPQWQAIRDGAQTLNAAFDTVMFCIIRFD